MTSTTTTEGITTMTVNLTKADPNYSHYSVLLDDDLPEDFFDNTAGKGLPPVELRTALCHLDGVTAPLVPAGTFRNRLRKDGLI